MALTPLPYTRCHLNLVVQGVLRMDALQSRGNRLAEEALIRSFQIPELGRTVRGNARLMIKVVRARPRQRICRSGILRYLEFLTPCIYPNARWRATAVKSNTPSDKLGYPNPPLVPSRPMALTVAKPVLFRGEICPPCYEQLERHSHQQISGAAAVTSEFDPIDGRINVRG